MEISAVQQASRRPGPPARRLLAAIAVGAALSTSLTGCVFAFDAGAPQILYKSEYAEPVVVFIDGTDPVIDVPVEAEGTNYFALSRCRGTGLRVETESGEALGQVAQQACPNWTLTIHADGSLTYAEDN